MNRALKTVLFLSLLLKCVIPNQVFALANDAASCIVPGDTFNSSVILTEGAYKVWVGLDGTAQNSTVAITIVDTAGQSTCSEIGKTSLTDTGLKEIGSYITKTNSQAITIIASVVTPSTETRTTQTPRLVFAPNINTPCKDINKCTVQRDGVEYLLSPRNISSYSEKMKVSQYLPYDQKNTINASYYFDNGSSIFSKSGFAKLNDNFLAPGDHAIISRYLLTNGQFLEKSDNKSINFDLSHYFFSFAYSHLQIIRAVAGALLFLCMYTFVAYFIKKILAKRKWEQTHIVSKDPSTKDISPANPKIRYALVKKRQDSLKEEEEIVIFTFVPFLLLLMYFIFNSWIVSYIRIDGISMETTLHDNKSYFYTKLPVTIAKLNNKTFVPKRGDVVVFKQGSTPLFGEKTIEKEPYVVKRVLGLPGERVVIKNGIISIYNDTNPNGILVDQVNEWKNVILPADDLSVDITLGAGKLFVCGDNRIFSIDSRLYGPINSEQIVGKLNPKSQKDAKPYQQTN
jgi:signal peptidase I